MKHSITSELADLFGKTSFGGGGGGGGGNDDGGSRNEGGQYEGEINPQQDFQDNTGEGFASGGGGGGENCNFPPERQPDPLLDCKNPYEDI